MSERTFVMVKPDAFQRGLVGEIVSRIEDRGLKLVGMKLLTPSQEQGEAHYAEHEDKEFYDDLVSFITSGPAVPMVVEGENAVSVVRDMIGATDPKDADPGTIRGDYALDIGRNCVHAADAPETAEREIAIYFDDDELESYERVDETWVYE
ncbi:MAG: nucleoside-diphosphate kinase [Halobacteriales archaeon]|nr:nucleoside-diphosphate kinase [Halobacteriales archaeon]